MGKGIFSFITGLLLFYVFCGFILTEVGQLNPGVMEIESGLLDNPPDVTSDLGAVTFMGSVLDVLTFTIVGVPGWVQVLIFAPLDVMLIIAVAFWARGISS